MGAGKLLFTSKAGSRCVKASGSGPFSRYRWCGSDRALAAGHLCGKGGGEAHPLLSPSPSEGHLGVQPWSLGEARGPGHELGPVVPPGQQLHLSL